MTFDYVRIIRFEDTDAAGVVYFAKVLAMCHEGYEESLRVAGIDLKTFFTNSDVAIPITHAKVDFYLPLFCGDRITIRLTPEAITPNEFMINYQIVSDNHQKPAALAHTKHVCIHPQIRQRINLPEFMEKWLVSC